MSEIISVDATTSTIAAVTELTNNALTLAELKRFAAEASTCEALGNCGEVQEKYRKLSIENQETMIAVCAADPNRCRELYGEFVEQVTEYREELDKLTGTNLPAALKNDVAIYFLQHAEAVSLALHTEIAADLQKRYGVSTEAAARLVAAASAVAGSIKGAKGVEIPPSANKPLGLGSTGRSTPANLNEKPAMEQAISNPAAGRPLPVPMTDSRWPETDGWVKSAQNINGIEIHYVRNSITGAIDDFKFK
jgi:hypothetical protein